jgi:hypothetical protein
MQISKTNVIEMAYYVLWYSNQIRKKLQSKHSCKS